MGTVHVSCSLDEDLQICRYISFVDLVELLKFAELHFAHANDFQRSRLLAAATAWRRVPCCPQADGASATKQARLRNQLLREWAQGSLSFQTWTVYGGADAIVWTSCASSDQKIGIVSTAKKLAESMLVRPNTSVILGKGEELSLSEDNEATLTDSLVANVPPGLSPMQLGVVANSLFQEPRSNPRRGASIPVVLPALISSVVVAPYATDRFVDLVAKLVGEISGAPVTRATPPSVEFPKTPALPLARPAYASGNPLPIEQAVPQSNIFYLNDAKRHVFS